MLGEERGGVIEKIDTILVLPGEFVVVIEHSIHAADLVLDELIKRAKFCV